MSVFRREARVLARLATPVALAQLASMLLWTVDFLMVGRLGVTELNAVSLGRLWVMGTTTVALGLIFGLDPIATQAHGARDREKLGSALLHGAILAIVVAIPVALAWLATGRMLLAFGQDPETSALAARYVAVQIPALPLFLLFLVFRQYLQARGIVRPAMWIAFAALPFNAFCNWLLIFGKWGVPQMGVVGAGVATAVTQLAMLLGLLAVIRRFRLQRGVRTLIHPRHVQARELAAIARYGAPIALQLAFEYWAFAIAALWAGRLGALELAAHSIALNLASITYMVPLGISSGATTRVGNLVGAGAPAAADRAARVALTLGGGVMVVFALLFVVGREAIPGAFSPEAAVVALTATLLPVVAAFELFDGLQVVGAGVLRGMGETRPAALANLVGYYGLGLPLGWWLSRPERLGLVGIWWGLALGLFAVAVALSFRVLRHGPVRRAAARA